MTIPPSGQVLNLASLVSYQDGAVVSRQIARAEAGNVTLFSFDIGQELSPHSAAYDALAYVLEGQAEIEISERRMLLRAGEAVIMPANEPHAVRAPERMKLLLIMLKG